MSEEVTVKHNRVVSLIRNMDQRLAQHPDQMEALNQAAAVYPKMISGAFDYMKELVAKHRGTDILTNEEADSLNAYMGSTPAEFDAEPMSVRVCVVELLNMLRQYDEAKGVASALGTILAMINKPKPKGPNITAGDGFAPPEKPKS